MAKNLDPSDPTPYFYDAIEKQTTNRPVEALQDMEKAIARNDNRAVYRSRLLLDQDLAARSASLARIYGNLGFQDLALVEGWKSVNTDPGNYSAHRFLADSYAALPRHEIARVSELLQSQLLQPINITPVQPSLGESNLLAVSGGGPSNLSFNEYNPLFERTRGALQLNGVLGQQNTAGGEAVASMLVNNVSASVGYYGYRTDGFRTNDDLKDTIFNLFAQASISPKTSLQMEYRNRKLSEGDLTLRWFPEDFSPDLRQTLDAESWRLGFHHAFAPGSDLIGNFMYQKMTTKLTVDFPGVIFIEDISEPDASSGEIQYLHRASHLNVVGGTGYFKIKGNETFRQDFLLDPTDPDLNIPPTASPLDTEHANIYLYGYLNYLKNVTLTLGISGDFVNSDQSDTYDRTQYNPKFGITWNPVPDTTLRAAAFRVLKRTLITDQTLEPTQVAGFNQFYDDVNSTDFWKYGVAVDQKFKSNLYAGLEFSKRDMQVPVPLSGLVASDRVDWDESTSRVYVNWAPHSWVALNAGYRYEKINRDPRYTIVASEMRTQQVPMGVNFFHPSGLSANARVTYNDQNGQFSKFDDTGTEVFVSDSDRFWLCDAAISYRFPERYGMVIVGAKNLFNQSFKYFDTDELNPSIRPERTIYAKITLSL
jgi:hypothetical protein